MHTGELPDPPRGLVVDLRRGSIVAIVGSGLSCAAGTPSWTYHLGHQRRLVVDAGAVERVLDGKGRELCEEAAPEPLVLRPTVSHRILAQLGLRAIVTTSYDDLIERAWPGTPPATYSWSYEHLAERIQDGDPFILKIHGDLRHPNDLVLAREDYAAVQHHSRARRALKAVLATNRSLWLGYGHNDPDLDLLLDECRAEVASSGGYAVGRREDLSLVNRLQNAGIVVSLLDADSDVPRYLQRLAELSGRPLVFTVTIALPWPGEAKAMELGRDLANALRPFGEVTVWGVEAGPIKLHLEAQADVFRTLRALVEQRDPALLQVLARHTVAALDEIAVAGSGSAPVGASPAPPTAAEAPSAHRPVDQGPGPSAPPSRLPRTGAMAEPATILFLGANPSDTTRLALDREAREIDQRLRAAEHRDAFRIEQAWAVRSTDLQACLLRHRPTIIHFSGHGSAAGQLMLADAGGSARPVGATDLAELFRILGRDVRCVVLNACFSEVQANAIVQHIDCVVGMTVAVSDRAAIAFAGAFYQALGYGEDVQTAFDLGCNQIGLSGSREADVPRLLVRAGVSAREVRVTTVSMLEAPPVRGPAEQRELLDNELAVGGWEAALEAWLGRVCTAKELRLWVRYNLPSLHADPAIARAGDDAARLAATLAEQIAQRGLATEALFDSLAVLAHRPDEVEAIRAMWRTSQGGAPPPVPFSSPQAPPPRPDAPPSSTGRPSHTSIVLDRIHQWRAILDHCETLDENVAFLVHGSVHQDLHLFLRRIESYLHHECRRLHRIVRVERTKDGTTARTANEWQRCLLRAMQAGGGELDFALAKEAAKSAVLFLFVDAGGPLGDLPDASVRGLVQLFSSRIEPALSSLALRRPLRNPVRFLLPIEHPRRAAGGDPTVQELADALCGARALALEPVQELRLPKWSEVRAYIEAEYKEADESLLSKCEGLYLTITRSPDPSLQRLGDALQRVLLDWEERRWYKGG